MADPNGLALNTTGTLWRPRAPLLGGVFVIVQWAVILLLSMGVAHVVIHLVASKAAPDLRLFVEGLALAAFVLGWIYCLPGGFRRLDHPRPLDNRIPWQACLWLVPTLLMVERLIESAAGWGLDGLNRWVNANMPALAAQPGPALDLTSHWSWWSVWLTVLLMPVYEEYLFRHLLYGQLRGRWGRGWSAVISSLAWAAGHIGFDLSHVISIFLIGLLAAALYEMVGSIWPCIVLHVVWNLICLSPAGWLLPLTAFALSLLPLRNASDRARLGSQWINGLRTGWWLHQKAT